MKKLTIILFFVLPVYLFSSDAVGKVHKKKVEGKEVFETYCWGCHHQTAVAFGPPFKEIANKRSIDEIRAMITDPKSVYKVLGYKRNAMPTLSLSEDELEAITKYILSFKDK